MALEHQRALSVAIDGGRAGSSRRCSMLADLTVAVAQLVRAPRCGRGCRGFESPRSPQVDAQQARDPGPAVR